MGESASSGFQLKTVTWLAIAAGLCVLIIFSAACSTPAEFASRFGASIALALGASLFGGLLGFLFGIPRTRQQESATPSAESQPGDIEYQINTNLEQISDWLTKILVGVGLVQLGAIGEWLKAFSTTTGDGFALGSAIAHGFVLGLTIYTLTSGFLLGYLWTRLFFGVAVRQADQGLVGRIERWEREARNDGKALSLAARQLNRTAGEAPVGEAELKSAVLNASSVTRTRIFYDAVSARRNDERRDLSIPVFRSLIASDTAGIYHQNYAQLAYALKDKANPEWQESGSLLSKAIEIRDRRGAEGYGEYEFNRAACGIELGWDRDEIVADLKKAAGDDWVHGWSLARQAGWLMRQGLTPQDLGFP